MWKLPGMVIGIIIALIHFTAVRNELVTHVYFSQIKCIPLKKIIQTYNPNGLCAVTGVRRLS